MKTRKRSPAEDIREGSQEVGEGAEKYNNDDAENK